MINLSNKLGFGHPSANFIAIGPEFGLSAKASDLDNIRLEFDERISLANKSEKTFEHFAEYHHALGSNARWWERKLLQPTYRRVVQHMLYKRGSDYSRESIRSTLFAESFAQNSEGADACLMELSPIPCKTKIHWPYPHLFDTKEHYIFNSGIIEARIEQIVESLREYDSSNRDILVYGMSGLYADHGVTLIRELQSLKAKIHVSRLAPTARVSDAEWLQGIE